MLGCNRFFPPSREAEACSPGANEALGHWKVLATSGSAARPAAPRPPNPPPRGACGSRCRKAAGAGTQGSGVKQWRTCGAPGRRSPSGRRPGQRVCDSPPEILQSGLSAWCLARTPVARIGQYRDLQEVQVRATRSRYGSSSCPPSRWRQPTPRYRGNACYRRNRRPQATGCSLGQLVAAGPSR